MPNPATGLGADVSKGLQKFTYALYLSAATGAGAAPVAKLLGAEPPSPWVRQGRLVDDMLNWNIPDPSFLEGRAGFAKVLKFRVVNQAEIPVLNVELDESDPDVMSRLRGGAANAATVLSSGAYTGYQYIYQTGLFYAAKVLLVGTGVSTTKERHFFAGNAVVTYKEKTGADSDNLEAIIAFLNDASNNAFTVNEWA